MNKVNWSHHLTTFGCNLLFELGESARDLPTDYNPITRALKDPDFVERHKDMKGFSRVALSRVATACQMVVFDAQGGPEGDGKPKALRRHWYAWYKTRFAQPLALQLGDYHLNGQGVREINDLHWTQRLSNTYAEFVDEHGVTYKNLWVEDASRMMEQNWEVLFRGFNVVVAVEKDSLFADFQPSAKALGARSVYSGKGKSSKAAIEKCLREHFGWTPDHDPFTHDEPLIILHVSDYDFDGEAVIGPTFGEQSRRYTRHLLEARVGIQPENVTDCGHSWEEKWYQVKVSNRGYRDWATDKALFLAQCIDCGHHWPVVGTQKRAGYTHDPLHRDVCPTCGGAPVTLEIGRNTPHGFEVEALKTRDYYGLLVDALLRVVPFEHIVSRLRDECVADAWQAAREIMEEICKANEGYQEILKEFDRLEELKSRFEEEVTNKLMAIGEPHIGDWRDDDPDPTPDDFRRHVETATTWSEPWRPFSKRDRTDRLVSWLKRNAADQIAQFEEQEVT
jgi:hypothetical protein